jgi:hypothetical protein
LVNNSCSASKTFNQNRIEEIKLEYEPDTVIDQAYFYQPGPACTRRALTDDKDFRWIVDFESDYLYRKHLGAGSSLEKKKDVYSPVLKVKSGIFYTLQKTASTFLARSEDNEYFIDLGNIAHIIAANVYVKSGPVTVKVDNLTFTVHPPGEIYFKNHCMTDTGDCYSYFKPNHKDKKKRSDFFLNYEAFDRKNHPEYQLHLLESDTPLPPEVVCEKKRFTPKNKKELEGIESSDESPCSAAGYGGGGGLPSSP